jgi:thiol-disulfide isomerase/thioredoxin
MVITINNLETLNNLKNVNFGEKVVFIKIGADWCIPCTELDKILVNIPNSIIYHISADNVNFESFFIENKIYSLPHTFIMYKNNTDQFIGIRTEEQINSLIEKLKFAKN